MTTEVTVIKASDYELDENKGAEVCSSFAPAIDKKKSLIPEYEEILTMEINAETCTKAGDLRKKLVKVRTQGIEATRKSQKNFALKFGQFVDAYAKKETVNLQLMESNLSDIEKHFENAEKERITKIMNERKAELIEYEVDEIAIPAGLGQMEESVWDNYLSGVRESYYQRKKEEKEAEEARIEKERQEREEQERVLAENEKLKAEREEAEKKLAAERAEREKAQAELKAEAEKQEKAKAELLAREKDKEHRKKINNESLASLVELGIDKDVAKKVVTAIAGGKVANIAIKY